jgi:hypothetical protein
MKYILVDKNHNITMISDPIKLHSQGQLPAEYKLYQLGAEVKIETSIVSVPTSRSKVQL